MTAARPWRWWACAGLLLAALSAEAQQASTCTHAQYLNGMARRESTMNPSAVNQAGYVGLFQMGEQAMQDIGLYRADGTSRNDWRGSFTGRYGVNSFEDFRNSPQAQVDAIVAYHNRVQGYIDHYNLRQYEGRVINGQPITMSGMVAGAHLVGIGHLVNYLRSNGATVPVDGNRTPITEYIQMFGGCQMGSTPPTFAQVQAATGLDIRRPGTGGPPSPGTPTPAPRPTPSNPGAIDNGWIPPRIFSPVSGTMEQAFQRGSGVSMADSAGTLVGIAAMMFMLYTAWVALVRYAGWSRREHSFYVMTDEILRAVLALMIFLLVIV